MGISATDILHWCHEIDLRKVHTVCDLGDQEIYVADPNQHREAIEKLSTSVGIEAPADILSAKKMADIWRALQRTYVAIDVIGDCFHLDLNHDVVPKNLEEQFDLVTNCGTTEHVFNQLNAFRVMHDMTRPEGFMYHSLPVSGYTGHGFFVYTIKFFRILAEANGYDVVDAFVTEAAQETPLDPLSALMLDQKKPFLAPSNLELLRTRDAGLRVVLRKHASQPFRLPMDVPSEGEDVYGNRRTVQQIQRVKVRGRQLRQYVIHIIRQALSIPRQ